MNNWKKDVIDRAEAAMLSRREDEQMSVTRMIERDKARVRRMEINAFIGALILGAMVVLMVWLGRIS